MTSIVIPYMQQLSDDKDGAELRYCLRAWDENAKFKTNVVLVGDKPAWYKGDHVNTGKVRGMPFARAYDIANKLDIISSCDMITNEFIYAYDDSYVVKKLTRKQAFMQISTGPINKRKPMAHALGSQKWNQLFSNTIAEIDSLDRIFGYETHLPRMLNREKIKAMMWDYELKDNPLLFSTLYYNEYCGKPDMILHKDHPYKIEVGKMTNKKQFDDRINGRTIICGTQGSWNGCLSDYLNKKFNKPSKYEKDV